MNYRNKLLIIFIFLLIFIPFFIYLISKYQKIYPPQIISPIVNIVSDKLSENAFIDNIRKENFNDYKGEYSIYFKNLKTGEEYKYKENKIYNAASLYKLWVMVVVYENISRNILSRDDVLASNESALNSALEVNSEILEESETEEKKVEIPVSTAIEKMITISDNYSALLLASKSGTRNIVNFLKSNSFENSNFKIPPQTSASDIGNFYNLLYEKKFINEEYSEEMIELLKNQKLNDRIPKYLPDGISIAHKTGELDTIKHDAGIIFTKKGDYILVVLTNYKDPIDSSERIALFSKSVFEYLQEN